MKIYTEPANNEWKEIIQRPQFDNSSLKQTVLNILNDVKQNGDAAVKKYNLEFDGSALDDLRASENELKQSVESVSVELKAAIDLAKNNIEKFHISQKEETKEIETTAGVICWRRLVAIEKVGLYIPGGNAPLFSTL